MQPQATTYRRFGAFTSSVDPNDLAARVKSIILAFSVAIIFVAAHFFHITLTPDDMLAFATEAGAVASAIWFVYGSVRAFVVWAIDKWNNRLVPPPPQAN